MTWQVSFYQSRRGDSPPQAFIDQLDPATIAKTIHTIELLETYGPFLRHPYSKKLASNLFELRIAGKVPVRIFYCFTKRRAILLHAFVKKRQSIPHHELKVALDRQITIL